MLKEYPGSALAVTVAMPSEFPEQVGVVIKLNAKGMSSRTTTVAPVLQLLASVIRYV